MTPRSQRVSPAALGDPTTSPDSFNSFRGFRPQNKRHVMDPILDGLNYAQREAVSSSAPILQVLAPPGSGKTKTLTARVAYLLSHHGYQPQDVICCTFTIKASREMRERLSKLIGEQLQSRLILGTFHSICRRYLVKYGYLIGLRKGFGIADSDDTRAILRVSLIRAIHRPLSIG
jgi:DNA helicase-2/ATP-dependent DNA helicase PcrA